jgi:hypothetical protein
MLFLRDNREPELERELLAAEVSKNLNDFRGKKGQTPPSLQCEIIWNLSFVRSMVESTQVQVFGLHFVFVLLAAYTATAMDSMDAHIIIKEIRLCRSPWTSKRSALLAHSSFVAEPPNAL